MPTRLSDLTYRSIYIIDNLCDDTPQKWHNLTNSIPNFAPQSADEVRQSEPCGLLKHLCNESPVVAELLDDHPQYIPCFNGLVYLYEKASQARSKAMDSNDPEEKRTALMEYAKLNLHCSCFARAVQEGSPQTLMENLESFLSDDFVDLNDPAAPPKMIEIEGGWDNSHSSPARFLETRVKAENLPGMHSLLFFEVFIFMANEVGEIFSDLDEEAASGFPTPNAFVNYFRAKHPDIDLQEIKQRMQPAKQGNERVTLEELQNFNPVLAQEIDIFFESYGLYERATPEPLVSLDAKKQFRSRAERGSGGQSASLG